MVKRKIFPLAAIAKEAWKICSIGELTTRLVRHYENVATLLREEAGELRAIHENLFAVWKPEVLNSFARGELKSGLNLESLARQFVCLVKGVFWEHESDPDGRYGLQKGLSDFFEI